MFHAACHGHSNFHAALDSNGSIANMRVNARAANRLTAYAVRSVEGRLATGGDVQAHALVPRQHLPEETRKFIRFVWRPVRSLMLRLPKQCAGRELNAP